MPSRQLILGVVDPRPKERLGYKSHEDVEKLSFFDGENYSFFLCWALMLCNISGLAESLKQGDCESSSITIQPSVDPASVFLEAELDVFNSEIFDQF
jgi:hypothetical protein